MRVVLEPLAGIPNDESDLIARIRAGDEAAFRALYLAHHDGLWKFAYTYVRSRDVAEELVQDVFLSLWGTRASWQVTTRVRAWLFAAVRNLALNHLRHERVVARTAHVESSTMGERPPGQQETVEANELDEAIERALAELPERRRIAMTLRWKEDMSPLEIANVLGTTPEAVRVLLSRARTDLAALLDRVRR
ncbi:MAG: polymerase sigma-70 factor [Gemmatimonadetes bacterium]|nr:polymerase sigma-70 factor [Gemmatimonadota bacterium]